MKLREIDYSVRQIERIRTRLQDHQNAPDDILRPRYPSGRLMCQKRFTALVLRLKKHEKRVDAMISEGALRWFARTY